MTEEQEMEFNDLLSSQVRIHQELIIAQSRTIAGSPSERRYNEGARDMLVAIQREFLKIIQSGRDTQ